MRILAISGSLRARSSNAAVIRAAASVAPADVTIALDESIGSLPHFNPDLDGEGAIAPPSVADFRARLAAADAILLCSPEYAHGVPGALKNALDWLVSDVALIDKRAAVIAVSPSGGEHAYAQLVHTLRTMSWSDVEAACLRLALGRAHLDTEGRVVDAALLQRLRASVTALARVSDATASRRPRAAAPDSAAIADGTSSPDRRACASGSSSQTAARSRAPQPSTA
jgi:NAD(P)H-dependent FMN reductase